MFYDFQLILMNYIVLTVYNYLFFMMTTAVVQCRLDSLYIQCYYAANVV